MLSNILVNFKEKEDEKAEGHEEINDTKSLENDIEYKVKIEEQRDDNDNDNDVKKIEI